MLAYLQKYNELPGDLKDKLATPGVMGAVYELEKRHKVSLATVIMRVMVRDISMVDLGKYFVFEHGLDGRQAEKLVGELKKNVFAEVADYLGFESGSAVLTDESLDAGAEDSQDKQRANVSNFFFSSEDEEEVMALTKKLEDFKKAGQETKAKSQQEINKMADIVVKEMSLNFSSNDLHKRYAQVVQTYIRGVRNKVDSKQTLMKEVDVGGLGLNTLLADKTIRIADRIIVEHEIKPPTVKTESSTDTQDKSDSAPPTDAAAKPAEPQKEDKRESTGLKNLEESGARDAPYDFNKLAKKAKDDKAAEPLPETPEAEAGDLRAINLKVHPSLPIKVPSEAKETESKGKIIDLAPEKQESKTKADIVNIKRPAPRGADKTSLGKVRIEDVRHVPKLTGPVDELREMDLVNFRRLGSDPEAATKKIKEKINFLEEENFTKRLEGIKAWRQSPVNKLYLLIGNKSIEDNKSINSVIDDHDAGGEYLSKNEFSAIMNLNQDLRY